MTNRERQLVPERQCPVYIEGKLSAVAKDLKVLLHAYGPDAYIDGETEPYSDSDRLTYYVYTMVVESDEQYAKRIEMEENLARHHEERDRAEFERLQAKFGGK